MKRLMLVTILMLVAGVMVEAQTPARPPGLRFVLSRPASAWCVKPHQAHS